MSLQVIGGWNSRIPIPFPSNNSSFTLIKRINTQTLNHVT